MIDKTDLALYVGESLDVIEAQRADDAQGRSIRLANMKTGEGVGAIIAFLRRRGGLDQISQSEEWY